MDIAVPVARDGWPPSMLWSGQVFCRKPGQGDFERAIAPLRGELDSVAERQARDAYFARPIVTAARLELAMNMLGALAGYLAKQPAGCAAVQSSRAEPWAVASAKRFIATRFDQPISLETVIREVVVSRYYFCRLFKQTTGLTFMTFLARLRVKKALALLADPALRITRVAEKAGFGSLPRFNAAFKQQVGMSPTQYRRMARLAGR